MKKIYTSLLVALLIVAFSSSVLANGQFVGDRFGPKAHGMGGAFTAVADDASAIYWNPAGLVRSGTLGVQTNLGGSFSGLGAISAIAEQDGDSYDKILEELDDIDDISLYLDGMASANFTNFGAGLIASNNFIVKAEDVEYDGDYADEIDAVDDGKYKKITTSNKLLAEGVVSLGTELTSMPLNLGNLAVGANVKYLHGEFENAVYEPGLDEEDEPGMTPSSESFAGQGYGLDAGALIRATNMLNVGVNVRNLVSHYEWDEDIADYDDALSEDEFQRRIRVGAAADLPFPIAATVAGDIDIPDDFETEDMIYHLGAEKDIILGLLSARVGMYGQENKQNYTAGLGLNVPFLDVNIAGDIINEIEESRYFSVSGTFRF